LKIIATGSSAFYFDKKFTDSLSGSKRVFELKTLSFKEWLEFKQLTHLSSELEIIRVREDYTSTSHRELMEMLNEYLVFGGYPAVVLEYDKDEKIRILKEIKDSFLKRDIDDSGVSNPDKFYNLLSILAGQIGNLVNRNELSSTIGEDHKTIDKYFYVLRNCFHIELIKPFFSNLRKELTKMPKLYFKDEGLRNVALNRFFDFNIREDQGALIENFVYKRLSEIFDRDAINYWRTSSHKEIDFIISTSYRQGLTYEVKLKCKNLKRKSQQTFMSTIQIMSWR